MPSIASTFPVGDGDKCGEAWANPADGSGAFRCRPERCFCGFDGRCNKDPSAGVAQSPFHCEALMPPSPPPAPPSPPSPLMPPPSPPTLPIVVTESSITPEGATASVGFSSLAAQRLTAHNTGHSAGVIVLVVLASCAAVALVAWYARREILRRRPDHLEREKEARQKREEREAEARVVKHLNRQAGTFSAARDDADDMARYASLSGCALGIVQLLCGLATIGFEACGGEKLLERCGLKGVTGGAALSAGSAKLGHTYRACVDKLRWVRRSFYKWCGCIPKSRTLNRPSGRGGVKMDPERRAEITRMYTSTEFVLATVSAKSAAKRWRERTQARMRDAEAGGGGADAEAATPKKGEEELTPPDFPEPPPLSADRREAVARYWKESAARRAAGPLSPEQAAQQERWRAAAAGAVPKGGK